MMTRTLIAALAATLALATAVHAQTKKDLVAKVVQLHQQGIDNIGRAIATQTSQQMMQAAAAALQRVPPDKREAVGNEIRDEVKKFYDEVEPLLKKRGIELAPAMIAAAYDEKFNEDELKTIIAWLESPVSRKYTQFDAEQSNLVLQKIVADTRPTIEPKLKALEATIARKLGLPPAGAASAPAAAPKKK